MIDIKEENSRIKISNLLINLLEKNYQILIPVSGYSMFPILCPGDLVYIRNYARHEYSKGDIIIFKRKNTLIAHRLISIKEKDKIFYYLCKGESAKKFDALFPESDLLAKVIHVKRKNRILRTLTGLFMSDSIRRIFSCSHNSMISNC
ncbi:signal peptidase I [Bacteroidota bacterium]